MRKLERPCYVIAIVVMILSIAWLNTGCATGNIDLKKPDDRFMVAQEGFNAVLGSYLRNYALADSATQAEWKKEIWPHFVEANTALDAWNDVRTDPSKERAFMALEDVLFDILRKYNLEKKEGAHDTARFLVAGNAYQNRYITVHALAADPYR